VSEHSPQARRPSVLLLGEAAARPEGLERALTGAGFQLIEQADPGAGPAADAILITTASGDEPRLRELLPAGSGTINSVPPRIVAISGPDPDGAATALALGAADALSAPVNLAELCARLHARIREHRAPSSSTAAGNGRQADGEPGSGEDSGLLEHRIEQEFERARRYSLSFSLVLLGIDEPHDLDDSRLRRDVEQTIRREVRVPDLVVPYGRDQFAILLPETGQSGARQSVVRVRDQLTSLPFNGDPRLEVSRFSAGIVTYPHPAAFQPGDLFTLVEAALMRGRAQAMERIGVAV
jgi:diguanylate cyclase (GGDEF)-like protein